MTLFEERESFDLFDDGNQTSRPDAVLRVVVSSSRDKKSRLLFVVVRNDGKVARYEFGLGWREDVIAIASVLNSTGYDIGRGLPVSQVKAWLFDFMA